AQGAGEAGVAEDPGRQAVAGVAAVGRAAAGRPARAAAAHRGTAGGASRAGAAGMAGNAGGAGGAGGGGPRGGARRAGPASGGGPGRVADGAGGGIPAAPRSAASDWYALKRKAEKPSPRSLGARGAAASFSREPSVRLPVRCALGVARSRYSPPTTTSPSVQC